MPSNNQDKNEVERDTQPYLEIEDSTPNLEQGNVHILLVEDNLDMQRFIMDLLIKEYQVTIVSNGHEALKYLAQTDRLPALVISDVMMPLVDGFALLERIKSHHLWKQLPMIMLTARTATEDKLNALTWGVDDYLTKPFVPQELIARVKNLISNHLSRTEARQEAPDGNGIDVLPVTNQEAVPTDEQWLTEVQSLIVDLVIKGGMTLETVAERQQISMRHFHRKLKEAVGLTPIKYQQEIQLQLARELIENKKVKTVPELLSKVGVRSQSHFNALYRKRFGKNPSEYLQEMLV